MGLVVLRRTANPGCSGSARSRNRLRQSRVGPVGCASHDWVGGPVPLGFEAAKAAGHAKRKAAGGQRQAFASCHSPFSLCYDLSTTVESSQRFRTLIVRDPLETTGSEARR